MGKKSRRPSGKPKPAAQAVRHPAGEEAELWRRRIDRVIQGGRFAHERAADLMEKGLRSCYIVNRFSPPQKRERERERENVKTNSTAMHSSRPKRCFIFMKFRSKMLNKIIVFWFVLVFRG